MTIILSLVTANYGLQASDRLLTVEQGSGYQPWDRHGNKSVIVRTRDGLISMGYSGPSFISGAGTDGWIAETLIGKDLGANQTRPKFGVQIGGAGPAGVLFRHLTTVTDRLNQAEASGEVTQGLTIDYVGLRWKSTKTQAWPTGGRIAWDKAQGRYTMTMLKRRWGWESRQNNGLSLASGRSEQAARTMLRNRLAGIDLRSKEAAAAVLIDVLRSLPPQDPTVGKDCLVTTIQRVSPHVHIKYEPYDIKQVSVAFTGRTVTLPAAFTPWIVAPGRIAAPQVITGQGFTHQSGGFDFSVEGPDPDGDLWIMSSQPRRRP